MGEPARRSACEARPLARHAPLAAFAAPVVEDVQEHAFCFNAFVNEPIIILLPPPTCNAHSVAMVLHDYCARYAPSPTLLLYAVYRTILVMAILCTSYSPARASARGPPPTSRAAPYICVCVCVCVCIYIYIYIYIYINIYIYIYIYIYICIYIYVYIYIHVCICVYMYMYMYMRVISGGG